MTQGWIEKLPDLLFWVPFLGWATLWFSTKRNETSKIKITIVSAQKNINEIYIKPSLIELAQELGCRGYNNPEEAAQDLFPDEEDKDVVARLTSKLSKFYNAKKNLDDVFERLKFLCKIGFWISGITTVIVFSSTFAIKIWPSLKQPITLGALIFSMVIGLLWLLCSGYSHNINEKASDWL